MTGTKQTIKRNFGKTRRAAETSLRLIRQKQVSLSMLPYHFYVVEAYREHKKEIAVKAFLKSIPEAMREGYEDTYLWLFERWDLFKTKLYIRGEAAKQRFGYTPIKDNSLSLGETVSWHDEVPPMIDWRVSKDEVNHWYSGQTVMDVDIAVSSSIAEMNQHFKEEHLKHFWNYILKGLLDVLPPTEKEAVGNWQDESEDGLF